MSSENFRTSDMQECLPIMKQSKKNCSQKSMRARNCFPKLNKKTVDMRMLSQGLREFTDMKELTPEIVNKLIQRIEIHNPEKKHSRKSVKVDIYFTAVGLIDIPTEQEIEKIMEQYKKDSQILKRLIA